MNQNENEETHKSKQMVPDTETLRANGEEAPSCKFYSCVVGVRDHSGPVPNSTP